MPERNVAIPAQPKEEIEIVVNTPAIAMEEVLPMAVSTHTQLAPEEVLAKQKREAKGDTERTEVSYAIMTLS
jgi:U3 small nucleolar ribonucleoprotein component